MTTEFDTKMSQVEDWTLPQPTNGYHTLQRMKAVDHLYDSLYKLVKEHGHALPAKYLEPAKRALAIADGE